jgi:hypothetical protein
MLLFFVFVLLPFRYPLVLTADPSYYKDKDDKKEE